MDFSALPPIAALLDGAHALLLGLTTLLDPVAGPSAAALAIVLVTLLVRAALLPLGALQVRADIARRRLAPALAELRRRHRSNPERLQRATMDLYRDAGVSPLAGVGPALAQAPVVSLLYGVAVSPSLNGHPNVLLGEALWGAPLGESILTAFADLGPSIAAPLLVLAAMVAVAWLSRCQAIRWAAPVADAGAASGILSWLPFTTVVVALFVPLAATLYLAVSTAWSLAERAVLRRRWRNREAA